MKHLIDDKHGTIIDLFDIYSRFLGYTDYLHIEVGNKISKWCATFVCDEMHIRCSKFIMRTDTSNMQRLSWKTWQHKKKQKTRNTSMISIATQKIFMNDILRACTFDLCVLRVLAYITISNQTMSSISMELCHFHILRKSLKRIRINFLFDTRVRIVYNLW